MNKLIPAVSWQKTIQKFTNKYICEFKIALTNYLNAFQYKKYKNNNYVLLIIKIETFDVYTISNIWIRKYLRDKIYIVKGKSGYKFQVNNNKLFDRNFNNIPL